MLATGRKLLGRFYEQTATALLGNRKCGAHPDALWDAQCFGARSDGDDHRNSYRSKWRSGSGRRGYREVGRTRRNVYDHDSDRDYITSRSCRSAHYEFEWRSRDSQSSEYPAFELLLNQVARIDVQMKVGQVSQTVEVSGSAPILKTESTQVDTIINSATNDTLPLATRNYVELTLLSPGAIHPDPSSFNNGDNVNAGARPFINGNREQSNNFLLDGTDNNEVSDNLLGYTPSPDAIQEFNLITNNAPAEFGNFRAES